MNYYIQGSAAKAEEIKAAFKKLGYDTRCFDYSCGLFVTLNNDRYVHFISPNSTFIDIIKTHPDYKELELPVQPKFKSGDWLVYKYDNCFAGGLREAQVVKVEDGVYFFASGTTGSWKFIDENCRLWTIADANDGDVLVTTKIRSCPFIYRKTGYNNDLAYYYAGVDGNGDFCEGCLKRTLYHFGQVANTAPATKEQRDLLFAKMIVAGYEWDAKKKELRKIKPHYDISNFKPFDKVLLRFGNNEAWRADFFSHIKEDRGRYFVGIGYSNKQCIPFEGNEHLLGTTDMPDECYINW